MEWVFIITCLVCAFIGMYMSENRGRSKAGGFILGLFLGLIGLAVIALLGDGRKEC